MNRQANAPHPSFVSEEPAEPLRIVHSWAEFERLPMEEKRALVDKLPSI